MNSVSEVRFATSRSPRRARFFAATAFAVVTALAVPLAPMAASATTKHSSNVVLQPHSKKGSTTTSLAAAPSGRVFGQSITMTATVTSTAHAFTNADKVQFYDGGVALGSAVSVTVTSTTSPYAITATYTSSAFSVGTHTITAAFVTDLYLNASTSGSQSLVIAKASTTTTINATFPVASVVYGQTTTFNVTVAPVAPGAGVATGTVAITHGAQTICTITLVAANNGTASCSGAVLVAPASGVSFTATYAPSANFAGSSSSTTLDVTQGSTSVSTFTIAPSSVGFGSEATVVFSAAVTAQSPSTGTPTGTVVVSQNATTLCTITLVAGAGHCSPASQTALSVNAYQVDATYSGDANYAGSSTQGALTVTRATTSLSAPTIVNSPIYGGSLNATTTLSSSSPSAATAGDVIFTIESGPNSYTCDAAVSVTGPVNCSTWVPVASSAAVAPAGSYSISTSFVPSDAANVAPAGPVSGSVFSIAPDTTTLTVSPSNSSTTYGGESSVSFNVTLTTGHGESIANPESATVMVGTATCIATLNPVAGGASGSCTISDTALVAGGPYSVSVTYGGDANLAAAGPTAGSGGLIVTQDSVTMSVGVSPSTVTFGAETAANFTLNLTTGHGEALASSEQVTISIGSASCVATLSPSTGGGSGSCSLNSTMALGAGGPYAVSATYSGDTNLAAAGPFSAASGLTVQKDTTSLLVSAAPTNVNFGSESQAVITVTLSTGNGETLGSAESVTVNVGGSSSCLATLTPGGSGGTGTCSVSNSSLAAGGPYTVSATYGGDSNLAASAPANAASSLSVAKDTASLAVTPSVTAVVFGNESTVIFTATVTTGNGESIPGSEPITIHVGTSSCIANLVPASGGATGSCSITDTALLGGGPYAITATYSGDTSLSASALATAPTGLTINTDSTLVFPRVSEIPPVNAYGNESATTFLVSVTTGNGEPLPDNDDVATVYVGSTQCSTTLIASGQGGSGTCTIANTALPVGSGYPVSVYFAGDASLLPNGPVVSTNTYTVTPDSTSLTVSASASSVPFAQESSISFNVALATGHGESLPGAELVTVNAGSASCVVTLTPASGGGAGSCAIGDSDLGVGGPYAISVSYPGDASLAASGPTLALTGLTVTKLATTTTITSFLPAGSIHYGQSGIFAVHVEPVVANANQPTGTVAITQAGSPICTVTLTALSAGAGNCTGVVTALPGTARVFTATYSGDASFGTSTTTATKDVTTNATSTTVTVKKSPVTTGGHVSISASVGVYPPGAADPAGTVNFTANGTSIVGCEAIPVISGTATCSVANSLSPGTFTVVAAYSGDDLTNASTSTATSMVIVSRNTAFINLMFTKMLGRGVDPKSLAAYTALLNKGMTRGQVAALLASGNEYKMVQIRKWINTYLHRQPTTTDFATYLTLLAHGATYEQVRASILGSNEYFARAGSNNGGFVIHLYNDVVGHGPSAAAAKSALTALAKHLTRAQVAMAVVSSGEARTLLVKSWLSSILQRTDLSGASPFVSLLSIGVKDQAIIAAMVGSNEFLTLAIG